MFLAECWDGTVSTGTLVSTVVGVTTAISPLSFLFRFHTDDAMPEHAITQCLVLVASKAAMVVPS